MVNKEILENITPTAIGPNLLYNGYRGLFPGGKEAGREADHSPQTTAEGKKMWIYTSTPPYAFMP
jgi:hypothetical protein